MFDNPNLVIILLMLHYLPFCTLSYVTHYEELEPRFWGFGHPSRVFALDGKKPGFWGTVLMLVVQLGVITSSGRLDLGLVRL